jgi:flagellin-like hook-associated protein FlgL
MREKTVMHQISNLGNENSFWETETDNETPLPTFINTSDQATKIKDFNQAIHNISLGIELTSKLDECTIKLKNILSKVKTLINSALSSNLEGEKGKILTTKVSLNLSAFDQTIEHCRYNGHNLLNGTLSVSKKTTEHFYISAGKDDVLNLNRALNIPPINTKILGLEVISSRPNQNGLRHLLALENAYNDLNHLQQRTLALEGHLLNIKRKLLTAIENHQAAIKAPNSYELTNEVLQLARNYIKK